MDDTVKLIWFMKPPEKKLVWFSAADVVKAPPFQKEEYWAVWSEILKQWVKIGRPSYRLD